MMKSTFTTQIITVILILLLAFSSANALNIKSKRAAAIGPTWPTKEIPYAFSNIIEFDFDARQKIDGVLNQIKESLKINGETCIEFVPRKNEKDYILFVNDGDCSSQIGYTVGPNRVSLALGCRTTGTIMHEVIHRLGFDHEQSRFDRDEYVKINIDNAKYPNNFETNPRSNKLKSEDTPYDFYSITHYNSDAMQIDRSQSTIISKIPALMTDEIFHSRDNLSPIDIYKVQKLYQCKVITIPKIIKSGSVSEMIESNEKVNSRFRLEASFKGISNDLMDKYLNKSYNTCGVDYYWPPDYPLVDKEHELYKLICIRKKDANDKCRFSIECKDEEAACVRVFFKKNGVCFKAFNDNKLNKISQKINDKMFQAGKAVKDSFSALKNIIGWKN